MNTEQREGMIDALEQAMHYIHITRFDPVVIDSHYGGIQVAKTVLNSLIEELNGVGSRVLRSTEDRYVVKFPIGGEA